MIELEKEDEIPIVKLDNPPMNAICKELLDSLDETLNLLEEDEGIHVVIIEGVGKAFVAGADISEMMICPRKRLKNSQKKDRNSSTR